jgi:DNA-binding protein H-NS
MAKIDLDALSIEELAVLRDEATDKLAEKVAARQAELEAELATLSRFGKLTKKAPTVAEVKPKKDVVAKDGVAKDHPKDPAVKAA